MYKDTKRAPSTLIKLKNYLSKEFDAYLFEFETNNECIIPYTPQQDGVVREKRKKVFCKDGMMYGQEFGISRVLARSCHVCHLCTEQVSY